jgi:predicted ATPase
MMDVFYKSAPVPPEQKQRVHFLDFMMEVHQRMHRLRQQVFAFALVITAVVTSVQCDRSEMP